MGRVGIGIGLLALSASWGCGDWQLRRHAAVTAPEPATYAWQEEGTLPAPPPVEDAPARGMVGAEAIENDTTRFGAEPPTFTVEALPPVQTPAAGVAARRDPAAAFSVQVFASRSREAAESIRNDVTARFRQPTWLEFEAPYYKVRVGECSDDAACQELRAELQGAGYAAAYVVAAVAPSP